MNQTLSIGIAGAGIGGLSAAAFLARAGHRVTVFDQFAAPRPVGAGLILQETGLTVLGALGLRAGAEALGAPLRRLHGVSVDNRRTVLDVRYAALRAGLTGLGIQRPALFDLVFGAARVAGAALVAHTAIAAADTQNGTLTDMSGAVHGPFDLIVDALGVRSPLANDPAGNPARELVYGALWATLPWPRGSVFAADELAQRYAGAYRMAGVMPSGRLAPDGPAMLTYFWSIRARDEAAWRAAPLADWKASARDLWPDTGALLDGLTHHEQFTFARYRHRTHRPVTEGRLVHIGDSWHAASPQLGQGANMALLDAYALSHAILHASDMAAALAEYVRMRIFHVRLFQAMSWLFTPVYQSDGRLLPFLRDWLAAPLSRLWPAPPLLAAMVSGALGAPLQRLGLDPVAA
jgi:salicylate hydroxylase